MDDLVKKATRWRGKGDFSAADGEVDEALLKPIKVLCKADEANVRDAARYLLQDVQQKNVTARLRCLCVMDCLFLRSHVFRVLICDEIRILGWSAGLLRLEDTHNQKRESLPTNETLKEKVKELVEVWDIAYGQHYSALRALARYFRESLKLKMPNVAARAQEHALHRQRREQEAKLAVVAERDKILRNARADLQEIESNVARLDECFSVIFPGFDDVLGGLHREAGQGSSLTTPAIAPALDWVQDGEVIGTVGDEEDEDEVEAVQEGDEEDESDDKRGQKRPRSGDYEQEEAESGEAIQWENASDDDDNNNVGSLSVAPFHLEVTMRTSLRHIETPDNAVVVQVMRELCKYLARYALPLLRGWQTSLAEAVALGRAEESSGSTSSSSSQARGQASSATTAARTAGVLRQCAVLSASVLRVLRRCEGIYDDDIRAMMHALG